LLRNKEFRRYSCSDETRLFPRNPTKTCSESDKLARRFAARAPVATSRRVTDHFIHVSSGGNFFPDKPIRTSSAISRSTVEQ
jgi:hypothetical protein